MIPEFGSWGFGFLIYLILGYFVTRSAEKSNNDSYGIVAFVACMMLWFFLYIRGIYIYIKG